MTRRYRAPHLLAGVHEVDGFECRSPERTHWLRRHARRPAGTGTTRVFVVTEIDSPVVAYYAWCMAQFTTVAAPGRCPSSARVSGLGSWCRRLW